jgi:hypothetical protein
MTALKLVPWGDVIEAAPGIAKSARKFFAKTQQDTAPEAAPPMADVPADDPLAQAQAHIRQIETRLAALAEQQRSSAALIESLAEQNAQVVATLDTLRRRVRVWVAVSSAALLGVAALVAWLAR